MLVGFFIAAAVLVAPAALSAESFDGTYTGSVSCPAFPNQAPLHLDMSVTVTERKATYQLTASGELTGVLERGGGPVSDAGLIVLAGSCEGGFSCFAEYRGELSATPVKLTGTQRWWFRSGERERPCEAELSRQK